MKKSLAFVPLMILSAFLARADYQLSVKNASASSFQHSNEILYSYDGDPRTIYHSDWSGGGFPITLTYNFFTAAQLNYLVYTPRQDDNDNGKFGQTEIWYANAADPTHFIKIINYDFEGTDTARRLNLPSGLTNVISVRIIVNSGENNFASCAEMQFFSTGTPPPTTNYAGGNETAIAGNPISVPIIRADDSNHEPGMDISLSYDNDLSTFYHSVWSGGGFPINLVYTLASTDSVNSLIYYPRPPESVNGDFGQISIYYNTLADSLNFQHAGDYDLQGSQQSSAINFTHTLTRPYQVKIVVFSGENNFASCAEMKFFRTAPPEIPNLFTDEICSGLRPGITQSDIDTISNIFYRDLAQHMLNGTYQLEWRVQTYTPYPTVETTAKALKINTWNPFENPTGILFSKDQPVVLFVKAPLPPHVKMIIGNMRSLSDNFETEVFALQEGINKITPSMTGLGYISYYDDNYRSLPSVTINIAGGTVNGYFDVSKHTNADWGPLIDNPAYPVVDIVGKEISFCFDKNALRYYNPNDGMSLINMYDSIVHLEHEMEGLIKYNILPKNRQFAVTTTWNGWRTGAYPGSMFELNGVADVLATTDGIRRAGIWGIAHEFGHANQISPDIDWAGMGEVTNNMYTIWCAWKFGSGSLKKPFETDPYNYAGTSGEVIGGKMNSFLNEGVVKGKPYLLQNNGDPFTKLVPLWQIMLYYQLAGQGNSWYKPDWLKDVSQVSRNTNPEGLSNGQLQLNFMRNVCDSVQQDLTDFFKKAGMLKPIDSLIDQSARMTITQSDIDALTTRAARYPKPSTPVLYYLSANSVDAFRYKRPVTGVMGAGVTFKKGASDSLVIDHRQWANVAAFEVYAHDTLISANIYGTNSADTNFTVVVLRDSLSGVFAVGWDGARRQVYPGDVPLALNNITLRAVSRGSSAELNWNLVNENNILRYEVQHSADGIHFTTIGRLDATGSKDYSYLDASTLTDGQSNYYRVEGISRDVPVHYSNIAELTIDNYILSTYPVPFDATLNIRLAASGAVKQLKMFGSSGLVFEPAWNQQARTITVSTASLASGVYIIALTDANGRSMSIKVLKK